jgi:hypothetical protein
MCRALPGSEYYGGSAPPGPGQRSVRSARAFAPDARRRAGPRRFPCSLRFTGRRRSPVRSLRHHHGYPAALPRGLPASRRIPTQKFPAPELAWRGVRAAPGPYPPPDLSRSTFERCKRRFLAYYFPSRSPGLHYLAVPAQPGFVRAACHPARHHPGQAALSSALLLRQERR